MAKRRQYNFRATPVVEEALATIRSRGEEQTAFINTCIELAVTAHLALDDNFWRVRSMAEKQRVPTGTLLGRLALAGLKGGKR
jgi:hypothetical protein